MINTLQKSELKNRYYYSGYMLQHYCIMSERQPVIVCMWDEITQLFIFSEEESNSTQMLPFMNDIDNMDEITVGFVPVKEIINE